jgi:predicted aldo/keto reductase-like oxidoreductase
MGTRAGFESLSPFLLCPLFRPHAAGNRPVCRLGLATRGDTELTPSDVQLALDHGVNFLNWCGTPNALSQAIAGFGDRREEIFVCVQLEARAAADAERELAQILAELHTDYVDVLTFYYVEEPQEWRQISSPGGSLDICRSAVRDGRVRLLGLTSHQRPLAAEIARSGALDMLMIRYNAAHRGAETEVFPVADQMGMPVVVYTCLRWGALLRSTPDDPPGFAVPRAPDWYRFALQTPSVSVTLMAPDNRTELEEDLTVLHASGPFTEEEFERLAAHGRRVRRHSGSFP